MRGKIKWFDAQKGYGFITTDDGKEIFVHFSSIESGKTYIGLDKEDVVEFEIGKNNKGPQAIKVNLVATTPDKSTKTNVVEETAVETVAETAVEETPDEVVADDQTEEVLSTTPSESDVVGLNQ